MKRFLWIAACSFLLLSGCDSPTEEVKREKERLDHKRLTDFYETAWVQCVNELGMDRCRIIQETGFQQCRDHRSLHPTTSTDDCVQDRFKDRLHNLPKEDSPDKELLENPLPEKPDPDDREKF